MAKTTHREPPAVAAAYALAAAKRRAEAELARAWYMASMRKVRRALRNQRLGVL